MRLSEDEAYKLYNDWLNDLYPLTGCNCNPFCQLLEAGDSIAYECGFTDFCDAEDIYLL